MNSKKKWIAAAAVVVLVGSASSAMAYGHRGGGYMGGGQAPGCDCQTIGMDMGMRGMMYNHPALTPEQRGEMAAMAKDFYNATESKRQDLHAKRLELNALSGNPNAKPEDISRLSKDIAALSSELRKAGFEMREKAQASFGLPDMPAGGNYPHHQQGQHHRGWR